MAKKAHQASGLPKASRRRPKQNSTGPRAVPDLSSIMDHFNKALSPIILCQRSLVELDGAVHEEAVLRGAIELLRQVYEEIDAAERLIYGVSEVGKQAVRPET
jgi:hypothetical protein